MEWNFRKIIFASYLLFIIPFGNSQASILVKTNCQENEKEHTCIARGGIEYIYFYDEIDTPTYDRFMYVASQVPLNKAFPRVYLNSRGGSPIYARQMGRLLRLRSANIEGRDMISPEREPRCASACVELAAGGTTRNFAQLQVHKGHIISRIKGEEYDYKPAPSELKFIGSEDFSSDTVSKNSENDKESECILASRHKQIEGLNKYISDLDSKIAPKYVDMILSIGRFYVSGDFKDIDSFSNELDKIKAKCLIKSNNANPFDELYDEGKLYLDRVTLDKEFINYKKAYDYFNLASKLGSDSATIYLGEMYANGRGFPIDSNAALEIILRVAKKGNVHAQWDAAQLYQGEPAVLWFLGESHGGVISNNELSYMWFNIAAGNGLDQAASMRTDISKKLSQQELSQAQKLSTECIRSNYNNCGDQPRVETRSWWKF